MERGVLMSSLVWSGGVSGDGVKEEVLVVLFLGVEWLC